MKTTETFTAQQVAGKIPCACCDCGMNEVAGAQMIQAYADQQVNKAIDECIQIFKDEFSLSGEDVESEDWALTKRLEKLKTKQP